MRAVAWKCCALLLGAGLIAVQSSAAAGKTVVLHSTGPSAQQFRPGRVLPEPLRVVLRTGDRLKVLDAKGTRELAGPAIINDATDPAAGPAGGVAWSKVITPEMRPRIMAVRGLGPAATTDPARNSETPAARDQLWQIDAAAGRDWCVIDAGPLEFWRSDVSHAAELGFIDESGVTGTIAWPAGRSTAPWPKAISPNVSISYTLTRDGKDPTPLTLHRIEPGESLAQLESELARHGCAHQLAMLAQES